MRHAIRFSSCYAGIAVFVATTGCIPRQGDSQYGESGPFTVSASLSNRIPSVVLVDWSTDLEGLTKARVEFGPDTDYGHVATVDVSAPGPYETLLVGSKTSAMVHLRVVAETAGGSFSGSDHVVTTGPVPASLPNLTVTGNDASHWGSYIVTSLASEPMAVILDADGDYVWWYAATDEQALDDGPGGLGGTGTMMGRAAISRDGSALLYLFNNVGGTHDTFLYRVGLDGTHATQVEAPLAHHDFVELPDGTVAYLAYSPRKVDGIGVFGDSVVELSPDGSSRVVYDIWDHYTYTPPPTTEGRAEWPHANAIDYDPEEDAYFVSFLMLRSIVEIDRLSGATIRTIGGADSDFTLVGGDEDLFDTEHQFEWLDGRILVFENGGMTSGSHSDAIEYALDDATGTADVVWDYWPEPSLNCTNLGDVDRLASGNTLVTFSMNGQIQEVDPQGDVVWMLAADVGGAFGYVMLKDDFDASPN
jgi:hypothetical protein